MAIVIETPTPTINRDVSGLSFKREGGDVCEADAIHSVRMSISIPALTMKVKIYYYFFPDRTRIHVTEPGQLQVGPQGESREKV